MTHPAMRFVIDTNLLVSALIWPTSLPGKALEVACRKGSICFSEATWAEILEVLARYKFDKYDPGNQRGSRLNNLPKRTDIMLTEKQVIMACRDPKDDKFLELAVAIEASCILTGDKDLLVLHPFRGIPILSAADFIRFIS